jgi:hypothetical protein
MSKMTALGVVRIKRLCGVPCGLPIVKRLDASQDQRSMEPFRGGVERLSAACQW